LEHRSAIGVPLGEQVGQAPPVALLVHGDAVVVAASRAAAARTGPASPRHQAARKSRVEEFTARLASSIPSTAAAQLAGVALGRAASVGALSTQAPMALPSRPTIA
jgi:hypothetical protein